MKEELSRFIKECSQKACDAFFEEKYRRNAVGYTP